MWDEPFAPLLRRGERRWWSLVQAQLLEQYQTTAARSGLFLMRE